MNDAVQAAFEAGIKLGVIYHQFVGTPVSPETAGSLETAIEKAVSLQPFVEFVQVRIDTSQMILNAFGYSELAGTMLDVTLKSRVNQTLCTVRLRLEDGYPMMKVVSVA